MHNTHVSLWKGAESSNKATQLLCDFTVMWRKHCLLTALIKLIPSSYSSGYIKLIPSGSTLVTECPHKSAQKSKNCPVEIRGRDSGDMCTLLEAGQMLAEVSFPAPFRLLRSPLCECFRLTVTRQDSEPGSEVSKGIT